MRRLLPLLALLVACSSDEGDAEDAEACNEFANDGPIIMFTAVPALPPNPLGGTIADGTYELTAVNAYTGPGGSTVVPLDALSAVLVFAGDTMQAAMRIGEESLRTTATFSTDGTTLFTSYSCPQAEMDTDGFSADSQTLEIYNPTSNGTVEEIYSKR